MGSNLYILILVGAALLCALVAVLATRVFSLRMKAALTALIVGASGYAAWWYQSTLDMEVKLLIGAVVLFIGGKVMRAVRPSETAENARPLKRYNEVFEWVVTSWSAVMIAACAMYFLVQAFTIPSGSMRMTFREGDFLFVNKIIYGIRVPLSHGRRVWPLRQVKRGDIVVFRCPPAALSPEERRRNINKDFIKRCVALAGDTVEVRQKKLLVNGQPVDEPYLNVMDDMSYPAVRLFADQSQYQHAWESGSFNVLSPDIVRDNFGPVTVPAGHYFVMGDNRDHSFDGRFWGPLPDNLLKGKALLIYWPPKRIRIVQHS